MFPEENWNQQDFLKGYWHDIQNQKDFLDSLAEELNIKTPSAWSKVTTNTSSFNNHTD